MIFRRRPNRTAMIEYINAFIEQGNEWIRAAFYSDPTVEALLETLYIRWRENNEKGEPIDYATDEEIVVLYELAKKYSSLTPYDAYILYLRRIEERGG